MLVEFLGPDDHCHSFFKESSPLKEKFRNSRVLARNPSGSSSVIVKSKTSVLKVLSKAAGL